MTHNNINDLKKQIKHKNAVLNALKYQEKCSEEDVQTIKAELDSLLYRYYKLLKCG